jgi:hypothetical protein
MSSTSNVASKLDRFYPPTWEGGYHSFFPSLLPSFPPSFFPSSLYVTAGLRPLYTLPCSSTKLIRRYQHDGVVSLETFASVHRQPKTTLCHAVYPLGISISKRSQGTAVKSLPQKGTPGIVDNNPQHIGNGTSDFEADVLRTLVPSFSTSSDSLFRKFPLVASE